MIDLTTQFLCFKRQKLLQERLFLLSPGKIQHGSRKKCRVRSRDKRIRMAASIMHQGLCCATSVKAVHVSFNERRRFVEYILG
jgi:hypothetical protein